MSQSSEADSSESTNDVCAKCGSVVKFSAHGKHCVSSTPLLSISKQRKQPKPRKTPEALRRKSERRNLKVAMVALVPCVSRAKAEAVMDACEGSMARVVGASSTRLARVVCNGAPLGESLGVAIFRAFH